MLLPGLNNRTEDVTTGINKLQGVLIVVVAIAAMIFAGYASAQTAAGSVITNQASATYRDSSGVQYTVTSNLVETTIQQAPGVLLTQNQIKTAVAGQAVNFPHVLTNNGNGADSFALDTNNVTTADDFDFASVQIFADADRNGLPDNTSAITSSPSLAAGSSFYFVVVANVPLSASNNDFGRLTIVGTSNFDAAVFTVNTDDATVTGSGLVDVTKSIDSLGGPSPGGPHVVTLDYVNNSTEAASNVTLLDALPAGMSYVAGSGRWNLTGSTVLTDANPSDLQGSGGNTVRFCAYDASCTVGPEALADADADSTNQVTAILTSVPANSSGSIEFQVMIDPGLLVQDLSNRAEYEYNNAFGISNRAFTNTVDFEISQSVGVVANGSSAVATDGADEPVSVPAALQGGQALFENIIWNTGNANDSFDVVIDTATSSLPAGTVFELLQSDGQTPLTDTSGNGIPDTGPVLPGEAYTVVLKAVLPSTASGNNGGAGFSVSKTARSTLDSTVFNAVTDRLEDIVSGSVDLTNDAALGDSAALGVGTGPEAVMQKQVTVSAGSVARFALYINNSGSTPDGFDLAASTDSTFSSLVLPAGWTVGFKAADGSTVISNSGPVPAAGSLLVYVDVSVPAGQLPVSQSIYFRALSPASGIGDVKHDGVVISDVVSLLLEPDLSGQLEPGGARVFTHRLQNTGNSALGPIDLTTQDSGSAAGWLSVIYADSDSNGTLGTGDQVIDSIASLAVGVSRVLFVKVFAPSTASLGSDNVTTLTATYAGGTASVTVADVTTVNQGDIVIVKEQAPDLGCDNVLDGPYTLSPFSLEPGNNCVRYRLVATNTGTEPMYNAVISDATPAFTVYQPTANCSAVLCTIDEPAPGGTGIVSGEVATILPGASVELTFAVMVE